MRRHTPHRLAAVLLLATQAAGAAGLRVDGAWVREAPPGAAMLAAYLVVHNDGGRPRTLVSVDSPRFDAVMLHRSRVVDGVARMEHVEGIRIPPGGRVALQPGGYHLMMPAPEPPPRVGERIPLRLHFQDGETLRVEAPVRRAGDAP